MVLTNQLIYIVNVKTMRNIFFQTMCASQKVRTLKKCQKNCPKIYSQNHTSNRLETQNRQQLIRHLNSKKLCLPGKEVVSIKRHYFVFKEFILSPGPFCLYVTRTEFSQSTTQNYTHCLFSKTNSNFISKLQFLYSGLLGYFLRLKHYYYFSSVIGLRR